MGDRFFLVKYYLNNSLVQEFRFPMDSKIRHVGYLPQCDIVLREDPHVSDKHLQFFALGERQWQIKILAESGAKAGAQPLAQQEKVVLDSGVPLYLDQATMQSKLIFEAVPVRSDAATKIRKLDSTRALPLQQQVASQPVTSDTAVPLEPTVARKTATTKVVPQQVASAKIEPAAKAEPVAKAEPTVNATDSPKPEATKSTRKKVLRQTQFLIQTEAEDEPENLDEPEPKPSPAKAVQSAKTKAVDVAMMRQELLEILEETTPPATKPPAPSKTAIPKLAPTLRLEKQKPAEMGSGSILEETVKRPIVETTPLKPAMGSSVKLKLEETVKRPAVETPPLKPTVEQPVTSSPKAIDIDSSKFKALYEAMEKKLSDEPPVGSEIKKTRSGKLDALRSGKYGRDLKLQTMYKKTLMIGSCLLILGLVGFIAMFFAKVTIKPEQPIQTVQPAVTKPVVAPAERPLRRRQPKDQAVYRLLLEQIKILHLQPQKPSQNFVNSIIKRLRKAESEYQTSPNRGDIYNLIGRLYYYKIFIDAESGLLDKSWQTVWPLQPDWKQIWQDEAITAWDKAKLAYQDPNAQVMFSLRILPWMPERAYHERLAFVSYANTKAAVADIEHWQRVAKE